MFALAANAGVVTLTFEGIGDEAPVGNYYNGGAGTNYGIQFGVDSLALISEADGGSGNFDGNPSGDTILFFLSGPGDVMDVAAGFTTGFSFYYSAVNEGGTVTVYSGLDGTGSVLSSLVLPTTPEGGAGCSGSYAFCPWEPFGVTFSGTAMSVDFSGTANQIGFDNVTLGSSTPTASTPEPAAFSLIGLGLASLVMYGRRKKA
jgi:hypothetical protein